ncbi:MAG TPA: hypothetical protein VJ476_15015 [Rhizomicrobium sp.]|nr:hypothetical protein [Rhizomicrobium sp.]
MALLPLAACSDADWAHAFTYADVRSSVSADVHASQPVPPSPVPGRGYTAGTCEDAARARSVDAESQGFDEDVQRTVYDKVYADCNAFRMKM